MFRLITNKKLKKAINYAYDRGINKGYELRLCIERNKGFILANDKPQILREADDILRNRF